MEPLFLRKPPRELLVRLDLGTALRLAQAWQVDGSAVIRPSGPRARRDLRRPRRRGRPRLSPRRHTARELSGRLS
eukprot:8768539-Alexandrium_andersonii.AAC.1